MRTFLFSITSLFILLLYVFACSTLPDVVTPQTEVQPEKNIRVYVATQGWHTGFIVPATELKSDMLFLAQRFGAVPYLEFGWGDKAYYQARENSLWLAIPALFWPTDTVMHVVAVPMHPAVYFPESEVIEIKLSATEFQSLLTYIRQSFYYDEQGQVIVLKKGLYGDSQFYQGQGEFYMINTCNKWTAKGLKSAGMDISLWFKQTQDSIISYLRDRQTQEPRGQIP